jgi:hypothetical protein
MQDLETHCSSDFCVIGVGYFVCVDCLACEICRLRDLDLVEDQGVYIDGAGR